MTVDPDVVRAVLTRDGFGCVAPIVDPGVDACRDNWGGDPTYLELDHVLDEPRMGKRAESDAAHLVALCPYHHRHSGWATSHRPELREYLRRKGNPVYDPATDEAADDHPAPPLAFPKRKGAHL